MTREDLVELERRLRKRADAQSASASRGNHYKEGLADGYERSADLLRAILDRVEA